MLEINLVHQSTQSPRSEHSAYQGISQKHSRQHQGGWVSPGSFSCIFVCKLDLSGPGVILSLALHFSLLAHYVLLSNPRAISFLFLSSMCFQRLLPAPTPHTSLSSEGGSVGKKPACSAGTAGDIGSIPGLGRSPGGGHVNPLRILAQRLPWAEEPGCYSPQG